MVIMKTNSIFKKLALAFCALAMFATQATLSGILKRHILLLIGR